MAEELSNPQAILPSSLQTIRHALHAGRVVSIGVANPHGPLSLEQLAAAVAAHREAPPTPKGDNHD